MSLRKLPRRSLLRRGLDRLTHVAATVSTLAVTAAGCTSGGAPTSAEEITQKSSAVTFAATDVYQDANGVHITGIDGTNDVIYDNDDYGDVHDDLVIAAKAKLGLVNLKGFIVSNDTNHPVSDFRGGLFENKWNNFRNYAAADGLSIPAPHWGADTALDTTDAGTSNMRLDTYYAQKYATNDAVLFIQNAAKAATVTPSHPLVYMAGGQLTTIAAALLLDSTIRDRIVVLHCDPAATNGQDGYAIYAVSKLARLVTYQFQGSSGISRAQETQLKTDINKQVYNWKYNEPFFDVNGIGDGLLVGWFFNNKRVTSTSAFVFFPSDSGPSTDPARKVKFCGGGGVASCTPNPTGAGNYFYIDGPGWPSSCSGNQVGGVTVGCVDVNGIGNDFITFLHDPSIWSTATSAPSITTQPSSTTGSVGGTATFSVVASGNPAPTYQWRKNGTNISGATSSSYTTPTLASTDNGALFSVVVSNSAGSVTSSNATLTIGSTSTTSYEMEAGTRSTTGCLQVQSASNASGGQVVGCANTDGDSVTFSAVNGGSGGSCTIVLRGANGNGTTGKMSLFKGGVDTGIDLSIAPTGGWNTFANSNAATVTLASGTGNSIMIKRVAGDSPLDMDKIDVTCPTGSVSIPAAPTGLTASPGNAQASLSWTASTNATSYNVKRSTTSGSGYTSIATGVTGTSYTNTGLTNGTTYYYVVTAVNSAGESGNSGQASATPSSCSSSAAPAAPTGLTAAAGNAQVSLSWTASSNATSYIVKRSTTSGSGYTNVATGVTGTSYTNTGLTNGTTYYYVVAATNCFGTGANSSQASATPSATTTSNVKYEAENGTWGGTNTGKFANASASGGYLLGNITTQNSWVQVSNVTGNGGSATLYIGALHNSTANSAHLYVNGTLVTTVNFTTGSYAAYEMPGITITLNANSTNVIKLINDTGTTSSFNDIDYFRVTY